MLLKCLGLMIPQHAPILLWWLITFYSCCCFCLQFSGCTSKDTAYSCYYLMRFYIWWRLGEVEVFLCYSNEWILLRKSAIQWLKNKEKDKPSVLLHIDHWNVLIIFWDYKVMLQSNETFSRTNIKKRLNFYACS